MIHNNTLFGHFGTFLLEVFLQNQLIRYIWQDWEPNVRFSDTITLPKSEKKSIITSYQYFKYQDLIARKITWPSSSNGVKFRGEIRKKQHYFLWIVPSMVKVFENCDIFRFEFYSFVSLAFQKHILKYLLRIIFLKWCQLCSSDS